MIGTIVSITEIVNDITDFVMKTNFTNGHALYGSRIGRRSDIGCTSPFPRIQFLSQSADLLVIFLQHRKQGLDVSLLTLHEREEFVRDAHILWLFDHRILHLILC